MAVCLLPTEVGRSVKLTLRNGAKVIIKELAVSHPDTGETAPRESPGGNSFLGARLLESGGGQLGGPHD